MKGSARFSAFAETMERVRGSPSKIAKVDSLAAFLATLAP